MAKRLKRVQKGSIAPDANLRPTPIRVCVLGPIAPDTNLHDKIREFYAPAANLHEKIREF